MGLTVNIQVSDKYVGPVTYLTAKQLCGDCLYKMGNEYIAIEDQGSIEIDKVTVNVGRRSQSLLFDIMSTIKMQSNTMDITKSFKLKKLSESDARTKSFVVYKIV